jgi:hypothetical protein
MGVARIQADQGMQGESSALLKEIIQDAPLYTDAYDLLAQNLIDEGSMRRWMCWKRQSVFRRAIFIA